LAMATLEDPHVNQRPTGTPEDGADAPLRAYVTVKQAIAQLLREIRRFAEHSAPWVTERLHDLTVRLAEDRFQLVVVGQFKRGKTSLMNAIVGRPLLPTGSIPVTSAVTSLRYGSNIRAVIRRAGQGFDQEIPIGALPEFITERGNPGNRKQVLSADIEVPAAFLRRGLHFVDTPGIGSAQEQNTATTLAFVPEADAAIFVTGADAPLSEGELEFLETVHQHVRKLFFVLNKVDQLGGAERDEVLTYTSQHLAQRLGVDAIRLFPVSAARALGAGDDADAVAASGLPAFEAALATFLNEDRQRAFLVAVLDRTVRLLEEIRFTLRLRERATTPSTDKDQKSAELNRRYQEQDQHRHAIIDGAAEIVADWTSGVLDPALHRFAVDANGLLSARIATASHSWSDVQGADGASRAWLRAQLEDSAREWLRVMTEPLQEATRRIASDSRADFTSLIDETLGVAGAVFGLVADRHDTPDQPPVERWHWEPPAFEPPSVVPDLVTPGSDMPRVPVPHVFAVRRAVRRLQERLPHEIEHATHVLRDLVLAHLHACVDDLDSASANALSEERRRIAVAMGSDEPRQPTSPASPNPSAELQSLLDRVTAVREAMLELAPLEQLVSKAEAGSGTEPAPPSGAVAEETAGTEEKPRLVTGTCAICAAVSDAVFDFLCHHQYAVTVDKATQRQFIASHGLCPTHTWHLERIASPRGLSASYPALLDETAARLQAMIGHPARGVITGIHALRAGTDQCPACLTARKAEGSGVRRVAARLGSPRGRAAFEQSQWLCLSHLELLLATVDDDSARDLLRSHARRLVETAESMREYVLKLDARRRNLLTAEEARAYRQALVLLVGERYLVTTLREE
jgi:hypothetical protein